MRRPGPGARGRGGGRRGAAAGAYKRVPVPAGRVAELPLELINRPLAGARENDPEKVELLVSRAGRPRSSSDLVGPRTPSCPWTRSPERQRLATDQRPRACYPRWPLPRWPGTLRL